LDPRLLSSSPELTSVEAASLAAVAAAIKKGIDVVVLDVSAVTMVAEAFVIASASNSRQVKSIAEEVERTLKMAGVGAPRAVEGLSETSWVLLDYGHVIVHVFSEEAREFYSIERLFGDATPVTSWADDPRLRALYDSVVAPA
jgi:ribosome-associated protein